MRNLRDLKIGIRLAMAFGIILLMMVASIVVSINRFVSVGDINTRIIDVDWVKAEAANTINATTRANARRTMELIIATDGDQLGRVKADIEANKKTISEAIATLDKLIYLPEGKALMAQLKEPEESMSRPSAKYKSYWTRVKKKRPSGP